MSTPRIPVKERFEQAIEGLLKGNSMPKTAVQLYSQLQEHDSSLAILYSSIDVSRFCRSHASIKEIPILGALKSSYSWAGKDRTGAVGVRDEEKTVSVSKPIATLIKKGTTQVEVAPVQASHVGPQIKPGQVESAVQRERNAARNPSPMHSFPTHKFLKEKQKPSASKKEVLSKASKPTVAPKNGSSWVGDRAEQSKVEVGADGIKRFNMQPRTDGSRNRASPATYREIEQSILALLKQRGMMNRSQINAELGIMCAASRLRDLEENGLVKQIEQPGLRGSNWSLTDAQAIERPVFKVNTNSLTAMLRRTTGEIVELSTIELDVILASLNLFKMKDLQSQTATRLFHERFGIGGPVMQPNT